MRLSDLQYELPPEKIAQTPADPRDSSRLMVVDRRSGNLQHRRFHEIGEFLAPGSCLVLNNTRVLPARFFTRRQTGGRIEGLFLRECEGQWRAWLKPSSRLRVGERLQASDDGPSFEITARHERGEWSLKPSIEASAPEILQRIGVTPIPPYIRGGAPAPADAERYQTVYARAAGAVAAPTAGLHFTERLLRELSEQGVRRAEVTLHVGAGTFLPIETERLAEHRMHAEWYEASSATLAALRETRAAGRPIIAVGTTSARTLESLDLEAAGPLAGWSDIFIYPPYRFRNVDVLLTNFHLPGSTLLALVMAMAGQDLIRRAYATAIEEDYRFYSYGDAMLIV